MIKGSCRDRFLEFPKRGCRNSNPNCCSGCTLCSQPLPPPLVWADPPWETPGTPKQQNIPSLFPILLEAIPLSALHPLLSASPKSLTSPPAHAVFFVVKGREAPEPARLDRGWVQLGRGQQQQHSRRVLPPPPPCLVSWEQAWGRIIPPPS